MPPEDTHQLNHHNVMIVQPERIQQAAAAAVVRPVRPEHILRQVQVHVRLVAVINIRQPEPAVVQIALAVSM